MQIHVHPINLDTSLLISLLPSADSTPFFTLLLDPWLSGTSTTYANIFSTQAHTLPPLIPSLSDLSQPPSAILISQSKSDHCSRETLLQLPASTPIYAVPGAYELVQSWKYFDAVHKINDWKKGGNGKEVHRLHLPDGRGTVEVVRLPSRWWEVPMLHSFLSIRVLPSDRQHLPPAQILYTPHGAPPTAVLPFLNTLPAPERKITLLFHPTTQVKLPFWLGGSVVSGAPGLERVLKEVEVEGIVAVHDEEKELGGLVGWFVRNIEKEGKWKGREMEDWTCCGPKELQLRNGSVDDTGMEAKAEKNGLGVEAEKRVADAVEVASMEPVPLPVPVSS
ncbi:hypothetical protein BJ508DRAFT_1103 [Ascobolus immersus RN42]|uniref:Metallo-beta-lactamase domain-containing protein n=1 Tax=Ascobolus immersus RN42 TaxID=1160509 RepID=A0A3N4J273_ASCIM|nr:hypothetical protein BJ508DRAFT_1103 [Ascobolus immersus RN42]